MESFKSYHTSILIVSGIHGDEPAGDIVSSYFKSYPRVQVLSDINQSLKRRFQGKDLNRHFEEEGEGPIQKNIEETIEELSPSLVIDLHEDDEASGLYAYCSSSLKDLVISALREGDLKIASSVHGEEAEEGVIINGKQPYRGTLERYLKRREIPYITLETPSSLYPLQERVEAMRRVVKYILRNF